MRRGAALFEVYPYKYFKRSYFPLSNQFGIHHRYVQNRDPTSYSAKLWLKDVSLESCMSTFKCRKFARKQDIEMTPSHVQYLVQTMKDIERGILNANSLLPSRFAGGQL